MFSEEVAACSDAIGGEGFYYVWSKTLFVSLPSLVETNKRGKIMSLRQQESQTAKNKNTKTAMMIIGFIV